MNNKDVLKKLFIESLSIEKKDFSENLEYNSIPQWDSIGHMTLVHSKKALKYLRNTK